ncbi:heavy metal-responsive transcriptional regulator [Acidiferrobacter sp.]|uniref:heavy metal-responsive transcriptional regulator n=1 Tax=Acidiferrobacter sp. TaxID=1872107 RepID=UPI002611F694|nr:heavy metal-responsive transcriptional regulator [Acidiferrobacter sp.]
MVTIGVLARRAGVGTGTLRYYETLGLIKPAGRSGGGYRIYHEGELRRLRFIRRAQELGFSLEEVATLLALSETGGARAADVRRLTREKLLDIDRRIRDLERMKAGLERLTGRCNGEGPASECPILAALNADDRDEDAP